MTAATDTRDGQHQGDTHRDAAAAGPTSGPAKVVTTPMASPPVRDASRDQRTAAKQAPALKVDAPLLADPVLTLAADVLDDLEQVRLANRNRYRQLTADTADSDGITRGFGLPASHPDVRRLGALVDGLETSEHQAELNLRRLMRAHPLGPWVAAQRGVGERQAARLLAAIGDPYWNDLHDRPRTVSELWAYCGYHVLRTGHGTDGTHASLAGPGQAGGDPDQTRFDAHRVRVGVAAVRARGQQMNWSPAGRMRCHLIAVSIVKAGGPFREVYDQGRVKYAAATHDVECRRCGPKGAPAQPGSALSEGHKHARALRLVCKAVLRELWREARRLHQLEERAGQELVS